MDKFFTIFGLVDCEIKAHRGPVLWMLTYWWWAMKDEALAYQFWNSLQPSYQYDYNWLLPDEF